MKILALDSSAVSASAAVLDDDKVLGVNIPFRSFKNKDTQKTYIDQYKADAQPNTDAYGSASVNPNKNKFGGNGFICCFCGARLFYGSAHWCGMCKRNGICTK